MFIPNTIGVLTRKVGQNQYAEPVYASGKPVPCAVVDFQNKVMKTAVRADSSASRGAAEEVEIMAKFLFPASVAIADGDKFQFRGVVMKAVTVQQRLSVLGVFDHSEVDFEAWPA